MAELRTQVDNALDETRMLILGAQVLLGFQFQGAFQSGFAKLPAGAQDLKMIGLALMLIAVGLLLAPVPYHQILLRGHDSGALIAFTNRIAGLALLPFALSIGIDVYVAGTGLIGDTRAVVLAIATAATALFFWFGLEFLVRRGEQRKRDCMTNDTQTDLSTRIKHVLTEARVVLPGVQALLGFQFIAVLTDSFGSLPKLSQYLHLAALVLLALSVVLLMAPAAFHRIVEGGEDTERLHTFASIMVLGAMVPLALGVAGDAYIVVNKVVQSETLAVVTGALALVFFYGLWFALPATIKAAR